MRRTRREVRSLGDTWNATTLWYAKAVRALQQRPIAQKTSWRYLAAMHGFDGRRWAQFGYLRQGEALPPTAEQQKYWNQCQHQSWYFLPWHRAYLLSFERILRSVIADLQGPDDWALPYWNYSSTTVANASTIPDAFVQTKLPDGSDNPLHVRARFGTGVEPQDADLQGRITEPGFINEEDVAGPGFGGPRTPFSPSGNEEGLIEAQPHDLVHTDVGGMGGIMSSPVTAGLDPIFWVHHANIDRLWEVWLRRDPAGNVNPTDPAWLQGPTDRRFAIFDATGADQPSRPADMMNLAALEYGYDDVSDPLPGVSRRQSRLLSLAPHVQAFSVASQGAPAMPKPRGELVGSNDQSLSLGPDPVTTRVALASAPRRTFANSFTLDAVQASTPGEPDRTFLRLENIRGGEDAATFDVFVKHAGPEPEQRTKVGSFSLFGVTQASDRDGQHAGAGLTKTLEITHVMDKLHTAGGVPDTLNVEIVPRQGVLPEHGITVGQITVHRASGR